MIINLTIFVLAIYSLGTGLMALLAAPQIKNSSFYLWSILAGIVFLVTIASILDVAKITLLTPMLAQTRLYGAEFVLLLGFLLLLYQLLNLMQKRQLMTNHYVLAFIGYVFSLMRFFASSFDLTADVSIIKMMRQTFLAPISYTQVATKYLDEFFSALNGVKSGFFVQSVIIEWFIFIALIIFGVKIITLQNNKFIIKSLSLGGAILSLALINPYLGPYILTGWGMIAILNLMMSNNHQAQVIAGGIIASLILNPIMWGIIL